MMLEVLADWAFGLDALEVPDDVLAHGATLFMNVAAVAAKGVDEEATQRAIVAAPIMAGAAHECRVIGAGVSTSLEQAAYIHGVAGHVLDFDETELATIYHATASVYSGITSLTQVHDVTGRQAMAAWLVGVEIGIRVAAALGRGHYDRGWHATGTAGPIAVATACSVLFGSPPHVIGQAMSIAATSAAGHRTHFGTDTKSGHVGFAASRGVHASVLARAGFSASPRGLEGPRGLLDVVGPDGNPSELTDDLGTRWRLMGDRVKPYASGVVTHPAIDAGRALRARTGGRVDEVTRVSLRVNPLVEELTGIRTPATGLEAKFSAAHCFAAGFVLDRGDPSVFTDEVIRDPQVARIRDGLTITADPDVAHMTMTCTATLADGSEESWAVTEARGSDLRPLTSNEVREKGHRLLDDRLSSEDAVFWLDRLSAVVDEPSMRTMLLDFDTALGSRT